jgi:hypothetical protein
MQEKSASRPARVTRNAPMRQAKSGQFCCDCASQNVIFGAGARLAAYEKPHEIRAFSHFAQIL